MSQQDLEPHGLLSGLPEDYVLAQYRKFQHPKTAVERGYLMHWPKIMVATSSFLF